MASGYETIENDGKYRVPTCIVKISDADGNDVYVGEQEEKVVYKQNAARMMTDILTGVLTNGTGKGLALSDMPSAGKTGTSNDQKDGWFVGYTRYYTTSVWVGYDMPRKMEQLMGSTYPGTIWKTFMETIHEGLEPMDFLPYAKVSDRFGIKDETQADTPEDGNTDNEATPDAGTVPEGEQQVPPETPQENAPQQDVQQPENQNPETPDVGEGEQQEETPEEPEPEIQQIEGM